MMNPEVLKKKNKAQAARDAARADRTNKRLKAYAERLGLIKPKLAKEGK